MATENSLSQVDGADATASERTATSKSDVNSLSLLADAPQTNSLPQPPRSEGSQALDNILGLDAMSPPPMDLNYQTRIRVDAEWAADDLQSFGDALHDFAEARREGRGTESDERELRESLRDVRDDFKSLQQDFITAGLDSSGALSHALRETYHDLRDAMRELIGMNEHGGHDLHGGGGGGCHGGGDGGEETSGGGTDEEAGGGTGEEVGGGTGEEVGGGFPTDGGVEPTKPGDGGVFPNLPTDNTNGPPAEALAAGYSSLTFNEQFKGSNNGFVPFTFYGAGAVNPEDVVLQGDHLILKGDNSGYGGGLATAQPADNGQGWSGKAFGGGAYWEATIAFDPRESPPGNAWPAFWALPIDDLTGKNGANRVRTEIDTMEYDTQSSGMDTYGGAVHAWQGNDGAQSSNAGENSPFNNYLIHAPEGTDWSQPHKYGTLWVPAKDGQPGYLQMFFDGKPTQDKVTWNGPGDPFGNTDNGQYVLILGTGQGWPMSVYNVQVWQNPNTENNASG